MNPIRSNILFNGKELKINRADTTGNRLVNSRIHSILRDPFYIGKIRWNDEIYDGKLDEKITPDFYNRKFKQYSDEKDEITESIKQHSTASTGYLNFGINLYELSQRAKGMRDEQRSLIRLVFEKLILDEHKLSWEYSKAFKILSRAVEETNCSKVGKIDDLENGKLEHQEKSDVTGRRDSSLPSRPIWLAGWDDFRTFNLRTDNNYPG